MTFRLSAALVAFTALIVAANAQENGAVVHPPFGEWTAIATLNSKFQAIEKQDRLCFECRGASSSVLRYTLFKEAFSGEPRKVLEDIAKDEVASPRFDELDEPKFEMSRWKNGEASYVLEKQTPSSSRKNKEYWSVEVRGRKVAGALFVTVFYSNSKELEEEAGWGDRYWNQRGLTLNGEMFWGGEPAALQPGDVGYVTTAASTPTPATQTLPSKPMTLDEILAQEPGKHSRLSPELGRLEAMCFRNADAKTRTEGLNALSKEAELGNARAMALVGEAYMLGYGAEKDGERALQWFHKGAEKGDIVALYGLDYCYGMGLHTQPNRRLMLKIAAAVERWYTKIDVRTDALANIVYGDLNMNGLKFLKFSDRTIEAYRRALALGHPVAAQRLGLMSATGHGAMLNVAEAKRLLQQAASQGDAEAMRNLADLIHETESKTREADALIDEALTCGNTLAYYSKATALLDGKRTPVNLSIALSVLREGARAKQAECLMLLGDCYADGRGVQRSAEKAIEFYTQAATEGSPLSMYKLGNIYQKYSNEKEAITWYRRAYGTLDSYLHIKVKEAVSEIAESHQQISLVALWNALTPPSQYAGESNYAFEERRQRYQWESENNPVFEQTVTAEELLR